MAPSDRPSSPGASAPAPPEMSRLTLHLPWGHVRAQSVDYRSPCRHDIACGWQKEELSQEPMRLWLSTENLRGVYYYSVIRHGVRSFRAWEKAPHPVINPSPGGRGESMGPSKST